MLMRAWKGSLKGSTPSGGNDDEFDPVDGVLIIQRYTTIGEKGH